ncbi:MAG: hypothetical protein QM723_31660 [Myxococcaceae bacterium]
MGPLLAMLLAGAPPPELRAPNPHLEGPSWTMDASVEGKVKRDQPATLVIKASARAGFHVNEDYPTKFTADTGGDFDRVKSEPGNGITLDKCDGDSSKKCTATVRVRFTPRGDGSMLLGGVLALGTCDKDRCLIDKIPVLIQVDVTP